MPKERRREPFEFILSSFLLVIIISPSCSSSIFLHSPTPSDLAGPIITHDRNYWMRLPRSRTKMELRYPLSLNCTVRTCSTTVATNNNPLLFSAYCDFCDGGKPDKECCRPLKRRRRGEKTETATTAKRKS